jgi:hypothetical protein
VRNGSARLFRVALAASLSISALLYFAWSWRWPLVGDASLIHYIGWLIERGWAPYRQLGDMNMPGSYLIEIAAMHVFGMGDLAWRLFDFALMGAAAVAFFVITRRAGAPSMTVSSSWVGSDNGWLAGLFASSLFILTHGRDGLAQGGQRDLTMAVCLVAATAFFVHSVQKRSAMCAAAFGLLSGIAFTIKPTAPLLTVAQLALALYVVRAPARSEHGPRKRGDSAFLLPAALAYLVAPAIVLVFLLRERALAAFLATLHTLVPYYASLGHRPLGFLLLHSISTLHPLVIAWLAVLALLPRRRSASREFPRDALLLGVIFGAVNCIVQARALPYYRYPLLVFLLPLIALDLTRALDFLPPAPTRRTRAIQALAVLGLGFGGFFLAPKSAILIHGYRWWQTDFISSLTQDLNSLGGQQLSHKVLCIDTNSGCGNVLYNMRLEPSNGTLSDFFLFGDGNVPVVRQTRQEMARDLAINPPRVMIVTSGLYLGSADALDYRKLNRWPAFESLLADDYTLQTEWRPARTARWWSREETPAGYRIYVLRARH